VTISTSLNEKAQNPDRKINSLFQVTPLAKIMPEKIKEKRDLPKACTSLSIKEKPFMTFLVTYITSN
jgi:hypothetical protein